MEYDPRGKGYRRTNCVLIGLPGVNDESVRLTHAYELAGAVRSIFDSNVGIDYLELLVISGDDYEEHILNGYTSTANPKSVVDETTTQQTLDAVDAPEGEESAAPPRRPDASDRPDDRIPGAIRNALEEHLPADVDLQIGNLDFGPLTSIPVPTSRLLLPPGRSLTPPANLKESRAFNLLADLTDEGLPHIYQVLIDEAAANKPHDYQVSARLAVFDPKYGIATDRDLAKHVRTPYDYSLGKYFPELMTNFDLATPDKVEVVKEQFSEDYSVKWSAELPDARVHDLRDLIEGTSENLGLLSGRYDGDDRYKSLFDGYPRMPVKSRDLLHFFPLYPHYYEFSPFGRMRFRDPPVFHSNSPGRASQQPDRTASRNTEPVPVSDIGVDASKGNDDHRESVSFLVVYFHEHGYEIIAVDEDEISLDTSKLPHDPTANDVFKGDSQPDIVIKKDGVLVIVEVSNETKTKPARILLNLARAAYHDIDAIVVADSLDDAQKIKDILLQPFKETTDEATRLYNLSVPVRLGDADGGYLLPSGVSEAHWWLTADGRLELRSDGEVLAEGDPEAPATDWTFNLPRYRSRGREIVIESASGEHLGTFDRSPGGDEDSLPAAVTDRWTHLRMPFIPTRLEYASVGSVKYRDGETLTDYFDRQDWDVPKNTLRYEMAIEIFLELFTVPAQGERLRQSTVRQRFYEWYDAQTDRDKPNDTWFGRAIPDEFDVDKENNDRYLVNRKWRFPPEMRPQTLPFVGAGEDDTGENDAGE